MFYCLGGVDPLGVQFGIHYNWVLPLSGTGSYYTIKEHRGKEHDYDYNEARLFNARAWLPYKINSATLVVDLKGKKTVTAIAVQGYAGHGEKYNVRTFTIDYMEENGSWVKYKENGNDKV